MTNTEIAINLRKIKISIEGAIAKIGRTRWRDSEKAMTVSAYRERIKALDLAIEHFSKPIT